MDKVRKMKIDFEAAKMADVGFGGTLTIALWVPNPFATLRSGKFVTLASITCDESKAKEALGMWRYHNPDLPRVEATWRSNPVWVE